MPFLGSVWLTYFYPIILYVFPSLPCCGMLLYWITDCDFCLEDVRYFHISKNISELFWDILYLLTEWSGSYLLDLTLTYYILPKDLIRSFGSYLLSFLRWDRETFSLGLNFPRVKHVYITISYIQVILERTVPHSTALFIPRS